mmetsp:Transcript_6468/g.26206  ORF Transcript_6468/g.26206 Transcript_6468/m.26206 type:complete len:235 (-) Transcript_6468:578-1282(-)
MMSARRMRSASAVCSLTANGGDSLPMLRGALKRLWKVRPPSRSTAAMPLDATASACLSSIPRTAASNVFAQNVLPVPAGASQKLRSCRPSRTAEMIGSTTARWESSIRARSSCVRRARSPLSYVSSTMSCGAPISSRKDCAASRSWSLMSSGRCIFASVSSTLCLLSMTSISSSRSDVAKRAASSSDMFLRLLLTSRLRSSAVDTLCDSNSASACVGWQFSRMYTNSALRRFPI